MHIQLSPDWRAFLSLLISHQVKFVLIGGHAVGSHGKPRLTKDLDVFVAPTVVNARRLHAALVEFGFGAAAPPVAQLARPRQVFMLGVEPYRIDILTSIAGVMFAEAWASRVAVPFGRGRSLDIIGRETLIKNKLAAGRPQDLVDAAALAFYDPVSPALPAAPTARAQRRAAPRRRKLK